MAPKEKKKRVQRYESTSEDEEEFQDYFTNPIKRKEFDRQRKKDQVRELRNIQGFKLGKFGLQNERQLQIILEPKHEEEEEDHITLE